jgi:hypothetical protein
VRDVIDASTPVYKLYDKSEHLQVIYPDGGHDFPDNAREAAYDFLEDYLSNQGGMPGKSVANQQE